MNEKNTKHTPSETGTICRFVSLFAFAGILVIGIASCSSNKKNREEKKIEKNIQKEIEEYAYPLPSAFELTNMLNGIEASYITGITNDPEKAGTYFTEKSKAVNLGIYTADLAYTITYNEKTGVQSYFSACETLIRELDFASAFGHDLADQIEASSDNKDQLVEVITGMLQDSYAYLNKQGRAELSYLILTGTVIEGLYLTTHISENTLQNPKITEAILFQKTPLKKLETLMEGSKNSEMTKEAYAVIQKINSIYSMTEGETSMTEEQLMQLTETIEKERSSYVQ